MIDIVLVRINKWAYRWVASVGHAYHIWLRKKESPRTTEFVRPLKVMA